MWSSCYKREELFLFFRGYSHEISGLRKKVLVLGDVILRCEMHASMLRCVQVRITVLGSRIVNDNNNDRL